MSVPQRFDRFLRIIGCSKIFQRAPLNSKKQSVVPAGFYCTFKSVSGATKGLEPQKVNIIAYVKLRLGRFLSMIFDYDLSKIMTKSHVR
jgi:hypothetical protein